MATSAERSRDPRTESAAFGDALSAVPPWVRERYAAEHLADASNEVTD